MGYLSYQVQSLDYSERHHGVREEGTKFLRLGDGEREKVVELRLPTALAHQRHLVAIAASFCDLLFDGSSWVRESLVKLNNLGEENMEGRSMIARQAEQSL